jgi:hypothetical protein
MTDKKTIYLKDYKKPSYIIDRTELSFELETTLVIDGGQEERVTLVKSRLEILRMSNQNVKIIRSIWMGKVCICKQFY